MPVIILDPEGAGGSTVTDATIATSDITTNDATTSKHGWLPKLGGGTSNFLRSDGTWTTPAGGGNVSTSGTPIANDFAKYISGTDIAGRSYVETKTDLSIENIDNTADTDKPISTAAQTALDGKVDENSAITGATKTKLTYDIKGLITGGTDATTADIADSTNKRYCTDAEKTVIGNTSGTNSGDMTNADIKTAYEANANTNALTDTEKTVIGNTSGTNTGDQDISGKLDKNVAITAATNTKITYDVDGLITSGTDATTADIADTTNKRYCTDAQKTVIGNTSGTNTGDQDISGKLDKNTPITGATNTKITYDNDGLVTAGASATTADIADSSNKRYVTDANLVVIGNTSGTNTGDQDISGKLDKNTSITGAVKTKITYDSDGLVTGGADASTADIADTTDKRYCTDAQKTVIGNTSGTNTGDQTISDATVTFTDITTNNAGTVKHGYLPKLGGGTTDFLRADGTWNAPTATGLALTLPASDGTYQGMTTNSFNSGYTSSAFGDLVFFNSSGAWAKVDSNAVATCQGMLGITLEVKSSGAAVNTLLSGSMIRHDSWNWTVGATLYAGETAGSIQATIPTGADAIIRVVGFALSANAIYFNPSSDQQTTVA